MPESAHVSIVPAAATLIVRTFNASHEAIQQLVEAGVLRQVHVGRRSRAYEAPDKGADFTTLERQLVRPERNTGKRKPPRKVPERR
jgi:hypothetical protein